MASSVLKWQLQVMGVWHWAPINRREKCILCQDRPGPDAHDDAHTGHFAQENGFNNNNSSGFLHGGFYRDENLSGDAHEIATASRNNRRGDQEHEVENDFEASCTVCKSLLSFTSGLSVHISWNYNVYSGQEATEESAEELISLNVLIFSEKFMSLVLPVVAVGGMDLCYLWRQFHYTLSRHRSSDREFFWERLSTYVHELDWNDGSSGFTMFLSVISLYTGLRLSQQNLDYNIPGGS